MVCQTRPEQLKISNSFCSWFPASRGRMKNKGQILTSCEGRRGSSILDGGESCPLEPNDRLSVQGTEYNVG